MNDPLVDPSVTAPPPLLSPNAPASYDATLAAQLAGLATLANQSLQDLFLQGDWALVYSYTASAAAGSAQYFLAVSPRAQPSRCALIIGAPWADFISYYTPGDNHVLTALDGNIVGNNSDTLSFDTGFVQMYKAIRSQLWTDIGKIKQTIPAFATSLPLILAGLGPGAPVAQLAALDLRPGKTSAPSQVASVAAYAFSCAPAADAAFAAFYGANLPSAYRVQAGADLFPSQPLPASGFVCAGAAQALPIKIPTYDSPWVERDGPYYQQLLTGTPAVATATGPAFANDGVSTPGFDSVFGFAVAKLCAVPYQMFQHPGSLIDFQTSPYVLKQNLAINGVVWASLFESPDTLVVAFRGTVSWMELIALLSNAFPARPAWISSGFGQFAKPLVELYAAGRTALAAALNGASDKPLILSGHDIGGALASLMALDLTQHPLQGQRTVAAVYSFGTPAAADPRFAASYAASTLGPVSFQLTRPMDAVANAPLLGFLQTLGSQIELGGGDTDPANGASFHALSTYLNLLDPAH